MVETKAIRILQKCEADLRALVATAATEGNYDEVVRITSLAKQVFALSAAWSSSPGVDRPRRTAAATKTLTAYPRFVRRGDQLVKIGWSKSDKREYEHKTPLGALTVLARAAQGAGKDGRIFQVSALLGLKEPVSTTEIPDYQVYLVVAWWRNLDLLDQHGRQGYSLANGDQFLQAAESAWRNLIEQ